MRGKPWPSRLSDIRRAGLRCRTLRPLSNGHGSIPAGTLGTVDTHGNSWAMLEFKSDPCGHCGVALRVTRLQRFHLELVDEGGA